MKILLIAVCLLWSSLAVEIAAAVTVPHGALLMPIVCGIIFWMRSGGGIVLGSLALIADWIARPTSLPLCAMALPFIAALSLAPRARGDDFRRPHSSFRVPAPLQLPMLTLAALLLHSVGTISLTQWHNVTALKSHVTESLASLTIIALPISALLSLMMHAADELGLRRPVML